MFRQSTPVPTEELPPAPRARPEPPALPRTDLECHATGCTAPPLVHWQRRLTDAEVEIAHQAEQQRRADAPVPFPDGIPLPKGSEYTRLVHACGNHAIGMDAAALIHRATCAGPDSPALPECDCEPEPHPEPLMPPAAELPAHWIAATAGGG